MLTVIHAAPDGKPESILVEKIPVNSALKGIQYPDSMAEADKNFLPWNRICGYFLPSGGEFPHRFGRSRRLYGIWKCDCV